MHGKIGCNIRGVDEMGTLFEEGGVKPVRGIKPRHFEVYLGKV